MTRHTIRDRSGDVVAYVDETADRATLRDRYLATVAYFEKRTTIVRDARGCRLGTGRELLGTLMPRY